jgi:hypothetical protein
MGKTVALITRTIFPFAYVPSSWFPQQNPGMSETIWEHGLIERFCFAECGVPFVAWDRRLMAIDARAGIAVISLVHDTSGKSTGIEANDRLFPGQRPNVRIHNTRFLRLDFLPPEGAEENQGNSGELSSRLTGPPQIVTLCQESSSILFSTAVAGPDYHDEEKQSPRNPKTRNCVSLFSGALNGLDQQTASSIEPP